MYVCKHVSVLVYVYLCVGGCPYNSENGVGSLGDGVTGICTSYGCIVGY